MISASDQSEHDLITNQSVERHLSELSPDFLSCLENAENEDISNEIIQELSKMEK